MLASLPRRSKCSASLVAHCFGMLRIEPSDTHRTHALTQQSVQHTTQTRSKQLRRDAWRAPRVSSMYRRKNHKNTKIKTHTN
jgi:hypothetical protein